MPRKPTGKPTGRPKKSVGAAVPESTATPLINTDASRSLLPVASPSLLPSPAAPTPLTAEEMADKIEAQIIASPIARADLKGVLDRYTNMERAQLRAALKLAQADVTQLAAERDALTLTAGLQKKTIAQLKNANTGLQAYNDAVVSEEARALGQKAKDYALAEIAKQARKDKAAKDEKDAAFIVEREERRAEYERRAALPYQDSAEDPNSAEDGASRQARIAHENNEQMLTNRACFDDYEKNWKGRTEPPPAWREPWADLHASSMTIEQIAKREWVANNPKATDAEKMRVGLIGLKPLPLLRPGF